MIGDGAIPDLATDRDAAVGRFTDSGSQTGNVDHRLRALDVLPHQINQIGPAPQKFRVSKRGDARLRLLYCARARVGKISQGITSD